MEETIEKEVLTTWSMQRFLRRNAMIQVGFSALGMIPLLGFSLFLCFDKVFSFAWFAHAVLVAIFGLLILVLLASSILSLVYSFRTPIVVVATRIATPVGEPDKFHVHRGGSWYMLYFHGYGSFILDDHMYYDSEYSDTTDDQLWRSTFPEDKFYLLLWKRSGGIINAYPCNNFEYVGELTPNKYEK